MAGAHNFEEEQEDYIVTWCAGSRVLTAENSNDFPLVLGRTYKWKSQLSSWAVLGEN